MKTAIPTSPQVQTEIAWEHFQLVANVQRVLEASGYPELQRISVKVQLGEVALNGRVSSYFQKQLAQEFVKRVAEVSVIRNEISVAVKSARTL